MSLQQVLIGGNWRDANSSGTFQSENPSTETPLPEEYPVSTWDDCDAALDAAAAAYKDLRTMDGAKIAEFLEAIADNIEARADELVEMAHLETALPKSPRLADVELPRTVGQLRQAADASRTGAWRQPVIDEANNIRACFGPIGPVAVFGPNNFPFAFGSASGGDFAAALAAGNPIIAKANSSHPGTTRIFADCALAAAKSTAMPAGTVQLIYRTSHADGEKLVSDPRIAATGYTGARGAGLVLKKAADDAGKLIYLELSSVNPVIFLPGAITERGEALAEEFAGSCLMGAGQFCTNPGMIVLLEGASTEAFISDVTKRFSEAGIGTLLSKSVQKSLIESLNVLEKAGAQILTGNSAGGGTGYSAANTLLRVSGDQFIADPETMQTEAFGNASLVVVAKDIAQVSEIIDSLEGNLTGCVYSDTAGSDDEAYDQIEPNLRQKVGRLLNDKMPTGVAVSPAMNHGGPYPATGHAGFTAVGIPAAIVRFAALHCYDNVRENRLPEILRG